MAKVQKYIWCTHQSTLAAQLQQSCIQWHHQACTANSKTHDASPCDHARHTGGNSLPKCSNNEQNICQHNDPLSTKFIGQDPRNRACNECKETRAGSDETLIKGCERTRKIGANGNESRGNDTGAMKKVSIQVDSDVLDILIAEQKSTDGGRESETPYECVR